MMLPCVRCAAWNWFPALSQEAKLDKLKMARFHRHSRAHAAATATVPNAKGKNEGNDESDSERASHTEDRMLADTDNDVHQHGTKRKHTPESSSKDEANDPLEASTAKEDGVNVDQERPRRKKARTQSRASTCTASSTSNKVLFSWLSFLSIS